ncbi:MAG: adenylate/guanylate cyclase domain-containing protein [Chrysiogenales bacterium]|nr:MAG: adenylate/guanylate cyclase domain-containing protein [Chrysiogenales bacterium]
MQRLHVKKYNPDYIAALQKREYAIENFLNKIRMVAVGVLVIMDVSLAAIKDISITTSMIAMGAFVVLFFIAYFLMIHHVTTSHAYRFWLKYVISTVDFGILFITLVNTEHMAFTRQIDIGINILFFYVLIVYLLIFISSLRYGIPVIVYTTFLGMLLSAFLVFRESNDIYASLYISGYILGAGIASGIISESMTHLVVHLQKREMLMRFLSKEIVDGIDAGQIKLDLGGKEKQVTIVMTDIRGFTEMLEKRMPQDIVHILNEYFTVMTEVLYKHGGIVDKFIGDAIMALFGIPEEKGNESINAIYAAQEMLAELDLLNARFRDQGFDPIKIGISINCGKVIAGNIGSVKRMDYTVIGDAVNVTSRLESLNKKYNTSIVFSENINEHVADTFSTRFLGEVVLRGRKEPTRVYTLNHHQ